MLEQEVREAITAGERALGSLRQAQNDLASARGFGIADMLGGGLIIGLLKHSRLNDASAHMEAARNDLRRFQKELKDVSVYTELHLNIGDFLTFADFFFDGLIADYMVQSRIADARSQVDQAISHVEHILTDLRRI